MSFVVYFRYFARLYSGLQPCQNGVGCGGWSCAPAARRVSPVGAHLRSSFAKRAKLAAATRGAALGLVRPAHRSRSRPIAWGAGTAGSFRPHAGFYTIYCHLKAFDIVWCHVKAFDTIWCHIKAFDT